MRHILLTGGLATALAACPEPTGDTPDFVDFYALSFSGLATEHRDSTVLLAVVDSEGSVVQTGTTTVDDAGLFGFQWPDLLREDEAYTVDFYADVNDSDGCDAPPTDHMWREVIPPVTADVEIDWEHSGDWVDVCATFGGYGDPPLHDLAFTASLAPHANQQVTAAVVDVASATVKTTRTETVSAEGALVMSWARILEPGADYTLDFFADVDGDGLCDTPPDDHAWRLAIDDAAGDVVLEFAHTTDFTDVCATFE